MSASFQQIALQLFINWFSPEPDAEIGGGEIGPLDDDQRRAVQGKFRSPPGQIGQGVAVPRLDVLVSALIWSRRPLSRARSAGVWLRSKTGAAPLSKTGPLIDTM